MPDGGYVIVNEEPDPSEDGWKGRIVNFALYKGSSDDTQYGRPLISKQCRVGNYVTFRPTDKLHFVAMIPSYSTANILKNTNHIQMEPVESNADMTIIPDAEFSPMAEAILANYGHDIQVTLNEEPYNGKLTFSTNFMRGY